MRPLLELHIDPLLVLATLGPLVGFALGMSAATLLIRRGVIS